MDFIKVVLIFEKIEFKWEGASRESRGKSGEI